MIQVLRSYAQLLMYRKDTFAIEYDSIKATLSSSNLSTLSHEVGSYHELPIQLYGPSWGITMVI